MKVWSEADTLDMPHIRECTFHDYAVGGKKVKRTLLKTLEYPALGLLVVEASV